jgi:hypothetical protein
MVLDRPLIYQENELDFSNAPPRAVVTEGDSRRTPPQRGWTPRLPIP